ncbi:MAG: selenocysteine-specific translation elongation factor [Clostridiales bacterium]|nr:selenocysteine-specific translation elongation factor [Clostridiales bacterium]
MANVIIGTAGHIDHGKTTLIRALTGIETDRLKEEKIRGITIELGFAYFDLPSGRRAGIVDVPGHEKFIKNMLAGVNGIDLVLFIVSAEEGIMPQTVEHFDILNILNVEKGIVVITKADMVDEDMLQLVEEDIKDFIKGTVLQDSPIIPVSAINGMNLELLTETIDSETAKIKDHNDQASFRLNIDRVFTMKGHGTVVTGTLLEGMISINDEIEIYPENIKTKARNIQVHGISVETAYAGQRTAINLANIKKEELMRGDVMAKPHSMVSSSIIDVKLKLLSHSKRELSHGSRIRFYHGTQEIMARLILLNEEIISPGDEVLAQLRLERPLACKYGDRFVVRFYSPVETVGGGVIIDPKANKHKRYHNEIIESMILKEKGSIDALIASMINDDKELFVSLNDIMKQFGESEDLVKEGIELLKNEGVIHELVEGYYCHEFKINQSTEALIVFLNEFHDKNSLKSGIGQEEVRSRFFKEVKKNHFDILMKYLIDQDIIKSSMGIISLKNFKIKLNDIQMKAKNRILETFTLAALKPPSLKQLQDEYSKKDFELINILINEDKLVKINSDLIFEKNFYLKAKQDIIKYMEENKMIKVKDLKDIMDISRKYSVPLLEHFDDIKLTKRVADYRILY